MYTVCNPVTTTVINWTIIISTIIISFILFYVNFLISTLTLGEVTSAGLLFIKLLIYSPHTPGCFTVLAITSAFFSLCCSARLPQHVFYCRIYWHFNVTDICLSIYLSILDIRGKNASLDKVSHSIRKTLLHHVFWGIGVILKMSFQVFTLLAANLHTTPTTRVLGENST